MGASAGDLILRVSRPLGFTGEIYVLGMAMGAAALMLAPATLMGVVFPLASRLSIADLSRSGAPWEGRTGSTPWARWRVPPRGVRADSPSRSEGQPDARRGRASAGRMAVPPLGTPAAEAPIRPGSCCPAVAVGLAFAMLSRVLAGPSPFDRDLGRRDPGGASGRHHGVGLGGRRAEVADAPFASTVSWRRRRSRSAGYMAMMSHIPMLLHPTPSARSSSASGQAPRPARSCAIRDEAGRGGHQRHGVPLCGPVCGGQSRSRTRPAGPG